MQDLFLKTESFEKFNPNGSTRDEEIPTLEFPKLRIITS